MEDYTSDSSDAENQRTLDLSHGDSVALGAALEAADPTRVETLLVHHNALVALPTTLSRFAALSVLDVSSNALSRLPSALSELPLTSLVAKNNRFDAECFPKVLGTLTGLRELNLSGNCLATFPDAVLEMPGLKYLYLGGNRLTEIPRDIGRLAALQVLCLGGNEITEVPVSVGSLCSLQALVLSDNRLESLPAAIANLKQLRSLLLHKNRLRTLPTDIIALKCLTELSLRENPLVVRFVSNMSLTPPSLLEHAGRAIKIHGIPYGPQDIPRSLIEYLSSAHTCVNPRCKGVFFDNRVEHVKFVDFCGKYRIPLLQYLCSSRCIVGGKSHVEEGAGQRADNDNMMRKVLLG